MIKRTILPNLVTKTNRNTSFSNHKQNTKIYDTFTSQINQQTSNHFLQTQSNYHQDFSSLSNIPINKKIKIQPSLHSQMNTIEIKKINPEVFHSQVHNYREKYQESNQHFNEQIEKKNIAPYFFKIHCSLKILQNEDELKRKIQKAQLQDSYKMASKCLENSKKKIQKKIVHSPSKKLEPSIETGQNTGKLSNKKTLKDVNSKKKFKTEPSQLQNTQSLLENRKKQLTMKGKEGKYTFQHFNSGQIFESIAELNEKKMLSNSDQNEYRVTEHCTYVNNLSSKSKSLNSKAVNNHLYESFKEEYNSFLKNKLPPYFGQNGNKFGIYEEWVQKRRLQQLSGIKSKVKTRTEPQKPQKADFMFSNQVSTVFQKKAEIERLFQSATQTKEQEIMINRNPASLLKQSSTQTSKMVSEMNSKMNTLRHGQSLQDKLKLKKLAKLQFLDKAKPLHSKNAVKNIKQGKQASRLSSYSNNNVSEKEMEKFMEKSQMILGKQFVLSSPLINPEESPQNNSKILRKKEAQKSIQLNEYETEHFQNVDALLKKQVSILRKEKEDLDSTPWRIPIKVEKKRLF